jgi:hypothetical protein
MWIQPWSEVEWSEVEWSEVGEVELLFWKWSAPDQTLNTKSVVVCNAPKRNRVPSGALTICSFVTKERE